jgi:peroxiredoxin Q/BCP
MNPKKEGSKAPAFSLKDKDGKIYALKDMDEKYLVIYFYPKDNTPGCSIEAREFSKDIAKYKKLGAKVIGVSGGDEKSKTKFCEKNNLKILLLSDTDFNVSEKYGVYGEKKFMGKTYMGITRTTFILDKERKIVKVFEKVKPLGHSKDVLKNLEAM